MSSVSAERMCLRALRRKNDDHECNIRGGLISNYYQVENKTQLLWLGGALSLWSGHRTCDQQVASSIPGRALPG